MKKIFMPDEFETFGLMIRKIKPNEAEISQFSKLLKDNLPESNFAYSSSLKMDEKELLSAFQKQEKQDEFPYQEISYGIFKDDVMCGVQTIYIDLLEKTAEIIYLTDRQYQRQKIASSVLSKMEDVLFESGINQIVLNCHPLNMSGRCMAGDSGYRLLNGRDQDAFAMTYVKTKEEKQDMDAYRSGKTNLMPVSVYKYLAQNSYTR